MRYSYVYLVTNKFKGTLYIGVTTDLIKRIFEHKHGINPKGFTFKYNLDKLVYYETFENLERAILREKMLKKFMREWKVNLIEAGNPQWRDLMDDLIPSSSGSLREARGSLEEDASKRSPSSRNARLKDDGVKEKTYA